MLHKLWMNFEKRQIPHRPNIYLFYSLPFSPRGIHASKLLFTSISCQRYGRRSWLQGTIKVHQIMFPNRTKMTYLAPSLHWVYLTPQCKDGVRYIIFVLMIVYEILLASLAPSPHREFSMSILKLNVKMAPMR